MAVVKLRAKWTANTPPVLVEQQATHLFMFGFMLYSLCMPFGLCVLVFGLCVLGAIGRKEASLVR